MSWAFNIPFKVERGESMKTVKAVRGNNLGPASTLQSCFDVPFAKNAWYVLKTPVNGRANYQCVMWQTDSNGDLIDYTLRIGYATQQNLQWSSITWAGTTAINAGDEFYELDVSDWKLG